MRARSGDVVAAGSPDEGRATAGPAAAAAAGAARLVLVTVPGEAVAEGLVRALVDEGLAACGTIVPGVLSIYRWRGAVEREREALVILKTTVAAVARLLERVPELHPYEVPEVLVLGIEAGHAPYLEWLAGSIGSFRDTD